MARLLYTLAAVALLPWAALHLLWRARRQPEYLRHLSLIHISEPTRPY